MRDKYVTEDGKTNDQLTKDKNKIKLILIVFITIIVLLLLFLIVRMFIRNGNCSKVIDHIDEEALEYAKDKKILPSLEGEYINIKLDDLLNTDLLSKEDITIDEEVATAKIKITKYKDDYFVTTELFKCSYCDSTNDKWSKEIDRQPKKDTVDVIAYYNYKETETNKTPYSTWYSNEELTKSKEHNMMIPKELPKIPTEAKIVKIEKEETTYYSYRDKNCKYYKYQGNYTNFFSSEQPAGYANKDERTLKNTEWTTYSLNYPEEKEYRTINKKTGYKYYYLDGKTKVFYNNGEYTVEEDLPDDKKYNRDKKSESVTMYRYRDKQWKWYNGQNRVYSTMTHKMPKNYNYVDNDFCQFDSWSRFSNKSSLSASNKSYREEKTEPRYRFRVVYEIESLEVLDKYLSKDEFEKKMESNLEELYTRENINISTKYKFKVKK